MSLHTAFGSYSFLSAETALAAEAALVSTSAEPIDSFDIALEAIDHGAKYILFPEWVFLPEATPILNDSIEKWGALAKEKNVYLILGARYNGRNSVFVFSPEGTQKVLVRRDGYNSPKPTLQSELEPFTLTTTDGKIGILICDESRTRKYFDEMKLQNIDYLFVPNYVGSPVYSGTLDKRYTSFDAEFDRFSTDKLPGLNGGTETHVVCGKTKTYELNSFGKELLVGEAQESETGLNNIKYSISYHSLTGPQ